jgi:hypothetical protein
VDGTEDGDDREIPRGERDRAQHADRIFPQPHFRIADGQARRAGGEVFGPPT